MVDLTKISTERRNPNTMNLDRMSSLEIVNTMNQEDQNVVMAVKTQVEKIAKLVDVVIDAFKNGGRLIYLGAGTSGRLGILDAVECVPTFGVDDNMVIGLIAGGKDAFIKAVEGSEDDPNAAKDDLVNLNLSKTDVVVGIAASGRTPYVMGGLNYAKSLGCKTGGVSCTKDAKISKIADVFIEAVAGPEVLTGSTRLKAGTSQKMILNMISTASMVGIGKSYQNLMVDVLQTNEKLVSRAQSIVMEATGVDRDTAKEKLKASGGSAKIAIVMIKLDCSKEKAIEKLKVSDGKIYKAIS